MELKFNLSPVLPATEIKIISIYYFRILNTKSVG